MAVNLGRGARQVSARRNRLAFGSVVPPWLSALEARPEEKQDARRVERLKAMQHSDREKWLAEADEAEHKHELHGWHHREPEPDTAARVHDLEHSYGNARNGIVMRINDPVPFRPNESEREHLGRLMAELDRVGQLQRMPQSLDADDPCEQYFQARIAEYANPSKSAAVLYREHTKASTAAHARQIGPLMRRLDAAEGHFASTQPMTLRDIRAVLDAMERRRTGEANSREPFRPDDFTLPNPATSMVDDTFKSHEDMRNRKEAIMVAYGGALRAAAGVESQHRPEYMMRFVIASLRGDDVAPPLPKPWAAAATASELFELREEVTRLLHCTREGANEQMSLLLENGPPLIVPEKRRFERTTAIAQRARDLANKLRTRVRLRRERLQKAERERAQKEHETLLRNADLFQNKDGSHGWHPTDALAQGLLDEKIKMSPRALARAVSKNLSRAVSDLTHKGTALPDRVVSSALNAKDVVTDVTSAVFDHDDIDKDLSDEDELDQEDQYEVDQSKLSHAAPGAVRELSRDVSHQVSHAQESSYLVYEQSLRLKP